jgi:hypothetical protein
MFFRKGEGNAAAPAAFAFIIELKAVICNITKVSDWLIAPAAINPAAVFV